MRRLMRMCRRDAAWFFVAAMLVVTAIARPFLGHTNVCHGHGSHDEVSSVNVAKSECQKPGSWKMVECMNGPPSSQAILLADHDCDSHAHLCDHTLMVRQGRAAFVLLGKPVTVPIFALMLPARVTNLAIARAHELGAGKARHLCALSLCARLVATSHALTI